MQRGVSTAMMMICRWVRGWSNATELNLACRSAAARDVLLGAVLGGT